MDWQQMLLSVLGVILTGLITWATERIIKLINEKIKNTKYANMLTEIIDIVSNSVKYTYQTYVEELKGNNLFNKEAQLKALDMTKKKITEQTSKELMDFIDVNFGDKDKWIENMIESVIYDFKKNN